MKRIFSLLAIVLIFSASLFAQTEPVKQSKKFERLLNYIDAMYVDTANIAKITEVAIVKMLQELDPHSAYISAEDVAKSKEQLDGSFDGIGVQFRLIQDTIVIQDVISGGPSEKVGLKSGDRIVKVDDEVVAGIKIDNAGVAKRLRGKKGTKVTVGILRQGEKDLIYFDIIRDKIPIHSVDAFYTVGDVGYVKLNKFARTTEAEMDSAFRYFTQKKVKNIILDLSDNTGGYLDQAVTLCSRFIEPNKSIVYTKGEKMPRYDYNSKEMDPELVNRTGKLVVIIDENSASASEITSGAIQDWDRGVIVGRRSFGKGLVQREMTLTDGSIVRLTIARYYTPSGRCIQKPYSSYEEYNKDLLNRYNHGEYYHKDSIKFNDSLKYNTLKYKRTVYGGGGIMPDDFVPLDTTLRSDYHLALQRKNIFFPTISEYIDKHKDELKKKYGNVDNFANSFEVPEDFMKTMLAKAKDAKINVDSLPKATPAQESYLKNHIKSSMASDIWGSSAFWVIFNQQDPTVKRAFEIIGDEKLYNSLLKKK
ncbi:MAG: S41 family peptidase [Bacteroidales bacterium]|nr:S41 family peptidase [Bacteroidales bacterium]